MKDSNRARCWLGMLWTMSLFVLCGGFCLAEQSVGPKIIIKERVFDFGEVDEGQVIEHVFQVFNPGDEILEIVNVKPG
jgi:hypothetical protein